MGEGLLPGIPLCQRYPVPPVFPIAHHVDATTDARPVSWLAASSIARCTDPAWSVMENAAAMPAD